MNKSALERTDTMTDAMTDTMKSTMTANMAECIVPDINIEDLSLV